MKSRTVFLNVTVKSNRFEIKLCVTTEPVLSVASCIISYGLQTVAFWGIDLIDAVLLRGSIANDPDRRRS